MISYTDLKKEIIVICGRIIQIEEELTDIDSKLGDGDMGISMSKGAQAVKNVAQMEEEKNLKELLLTCAQALNKAAPSTMGTILASSLIALARYVANKNVLTQEELVAVPGILAEAIIKRGKARVGDKTILDALVPYAETILGVYTKTKNMENAKGQALRAAVQGMESTKGMIAKTGRASWLGDRNKEYPDAGAYMFCRIVEIL